MQKQMDNPHAVSASSNLPSLRNADRLEAPLADLRQILESKHPLAFDIHTATFLIGLFLYEVIHGKGPYWDRPDELLNAVHQSGIDEFLHRLAGRHPIVSIEEEDVIEAYRLTDDVCQLLSSGERQQDESSETVDKVHFDVDSPIDSWQSVGKQMSVWADRVRDRVTSNRQVVYFQKMSTLIELAFYAKELYVRESLTRQLSALEELMDSEAFVGLVQRAIVQYNLGKGATLSQDKFLESIHISRQLIRELILIDNGCSS